MPFFLNLVFYIDCRMSIWMVADVLQSILCMILLGYSIFIGLMF